MQQFLGDEEQSFEQRALNYPKLTLAEQGVVLPAYAKSIGSQCEKQPLKGSFQSGFEIALVDGDKIAKNCIFYTVLPESDAGQLPDDAF